MTEQEKQVILQHAFELPERLRLAILVGFAFPSVKECLIRRTLGSLRNEILADDRTAWQCVTEYKPDRFFLNVNKASWPADVCVCFEWSKAENDAWLGVRRRTGDDRCPLDDDLNRNLSAGLPSLRPGRLHYPGYSWWAYLNRYRDWNAEETLIAAANGSDVTDHIGGLLVQVCQIAKPIIDAAFPH